MIEPNMLDPSVHDLSVRLASVGITIALFWFMMTAIKLLKSKDDKENLSQNQRVGVPHIDRDEQRRRARSGEEDHR